MARWEDVAASLRDAIVSGEHPPGSAIPKEAELIERHRVSRITVRRAIAQLTAEGIVQPVRRRGTIVRERPPRVRIDRSRRVHKDEIGYYFDPAAQPWRALRTPTRKWVPCPYDVAHLLQIDPGSEVLMRDRVMGEPETGTAFQLATSYIPASIARGTQITEADTGPGGIYARFEEMGHHLHWYEAISARMPTPAETELLKLAPGVPLLCIIRTTSSSTGTALEVNDTRMDAERFEVGSRIARDRSARTLPE